VFAAGILLMSVGALFSGLSKFSAAAYNELCRRGRRDFHTGGCQSFDTACCAAEGVRQEHQHSPFAFRARVFYRAPCSHEACGEQYQLEIFLFHHCRCVSFPVLFCEKA